MMSLFWEPTPEFNASFSMEIFFDTAESAITNLESAAPRPVISVAEAEADLFTRFPAFELSDTNANNPTKIT